jgi:hypothetical protein
MIRLFAVTVLLGVWGVSSGYAQGYAALVFEMSAQPGTMRFCDAEGSTGKVNNYIRAYETVTGGSALRMILIAQDIPSAGSGMRWVKLHMIYTTNNFEDVIVNVPDGSGIVNFSGQYFSGTLMYYPPPSFGVWSQSCNTVKVYDSPGVGERIIEATDNPANGNSWRIVQRQAQTDYGTVTASALQAAGIFQPYGQVWLRYRDDFPVDSGMQSYKNSRVSSPVPVDLNAAPPTVIPGTPEDAACYGEATGSVVLSISSPDVANFLVTGDNLSTPQSPDVQVSVGRGANKISNLAAATWNFTVENDAGDMLGHCNTGTPVIISQPAVPLTVAITTSNYNNYGVSCNDGADGTAVAVASGGNGTIKTTTGVQAPQLPG